MNTVAAFPKTGRPLLRWNAAVDRFMERNLPRGRCTAGGRDPRVLFSLHPDPKMRSAPGFQLAQPRQPACRGRGGVQCPMNRLICCWSVTCPTETAVSKILLGATILLALAGAAKAADITTAPITTGGIVIHIDGDITPGDEETFSALTISDPDKSLVWVSGAGGSLVVAFRMGKQIKKLGLTTVVNTGGGCASSCAMIWMAGRHAIIERNSELVFHAPYDPRSPDKPSQPAIDAMVAYLMEVAGLTEQQALALATAAPPSEGWTATEAAARVLGFRPQVVSLLGAAPFVGAAQTCKAKFCLAV